MIRSMPLGRSEISVMPKKSYGISARLYNLDIVISKLSLIMLFEFTYQVNYFNIPDVFWQTNEA
jgi:hypothetical protein